jgi:hypothetical protein
MASDAFYTQLYVALTNLYRHSVCRVDESALHCSNEVQDSGAEPPSENHMKTLPLLILVFSAAGCATLGTVPGTAGNGGPAAGDATTSAAATMDSPFPHPAFQDQNMGPRSVLPATGGAPVLGIPLGGDMFLPVTGGAPIVGIPTGP